MKIKLQLQKRSLEGGLVSHRAEGKLLHEINVLVNKYYSEQQDTFVYLFSIQNDSAINTDLFHRQYNLNERFIGSKLHKS